MALPLIARGPGLLMCFPLNCHYFGNLGAAVEWALHLTIHATGTDTRSRRRRGDPRDCLVHVGQRELQCRQAGSGVEALALLESGEEFELMLTDLMMDKMNGTQLLERAKERFPDMPVIMVTAVHDISVALGAMRNGAYDYLLKPFEREQLLATVRRALENRRLKLENRAYQTNLEAKVDARTRQLQEAWADLERSYDITLEALGDALDLKDAETEGHSKRVTAFTIAIARVMGIPDEQIRIIARGAFLHDIGKMAIPDAILRKPGALTPDEVRDHA